MWSFKGLQRPPGDRTARAAKWEGMARSWEVVGGHCPTFWNASGGSLSVFGVEETRRQREVTVLLRCDPNLEQ